MALMNEIEAAQELNVAVSTLRKWRITRRGPDYLKLSRLVRYEPEAIVRFKAQSARQMPAPSET